MTTHFRRIVRVFVASLPLLAACNSTDSLHAPYTKPDGPTHAGPVAHAAKRHFVWVRKFSTSWGGDAPGRDARSTLTEDATRVVRRIFEQAPGVLLDDPASDVANEFELRGTLEGNTRGAHAATLVLSAADGSELARERCVFTASTSAPFDERALAEAAQRLAALVEAQAWSSSVLAVSKRMLTLASGAASGLTVNERLTVRKRPSWSRAADGSVVRIPGDDVASVAVDALLERDGAPRGAYCRLIAGGFSEFEPHEIVVEEP